MRKIEESEMRYARKADIARLFRVALPTVYRRVAGIEAEIGQRYNEFAIIDELISLAVYADYEKYHKRLKDKNLRKTVPDFDMGKALTYLQIMVRKEVDIA